MQLDQAYLKWGLGLVNVILKCGEKIMETNKLLLPTSHVRFGLAQVDITPPVGIYHPLWGAAVHDRSTGVHRSLRGEVMVFGPVEDTEERDPSMLIRAQLDLPGLVDSRQHGGFLGALFEAGGVPSDRILVSYSHTHAAGWFAPNRYGMPGGELILPYLEEVGEKIQMACRQASYGMQEAFISYATGKCNLAANRDFWDGTKGGYACGFNPEGEVDDTILVARITDLSGSVIATVVNYGCHPTTLAWENTLISPDYVGAMREEVEKATKAPCVFILGACGDLGPWDGFVGDVEVADRNGKQLGYAALSALMSMGPPATDFEYQGPKVSGATVGVWAHVPFKEDRIMQVAQFSGDTYKIDLPLKSRPDREKIKEEMEEWKAKELEAEEQGDDTKALDYRAHSERALRWMGRLDSIPPGKTYPMPFSVYRMGNAIWVTCGGEPYQLIQTELRKKFPEFAILFSPLVGIMNIAYLLPRGSYGKGLYQEEVSLLAPGSLEILTEAISDKIEEIIN